MNMGIDTQREVRKPREEQFARNDQTADPVEYRQEDQGNDHESEGHRDTAGQNHQRGDADHDANDQRAHAPGTPPSSSCSRGRGRPVTRQRTSAVYCSVRMPRPTGRVSNGIHSGGPQTDSVVQPNSHAS